MLPIFKDGALDNFPDTRITHAYNGLSMNVETDDNDDTYELNSVVATVQIASVSDPSAQDDGSESYKARKLAKLLRVDGTLRAKTWARFWDKVASLEKAFDPAKVSHENASTQGYLAYTFDIPTEDLTNYPNGLMASQYFARARSAVVVPHSEYSGPAAFFTLELLCVDPRRYLQSTESRTLAGSTTVAIGNTKASYRSWPTTTITMTGAGNSAYTIKGDAYGLVTLTLNLSSLILNDVIIVDHEKRKITKAGVDVTGTIYVSGDYFPVEPSSYQAGNLVTTNGTNASAAVVWRPAFV